MQEFKLISGLGAGVTQNSHSRHLYGASEKIDARYKNYFASVQLGIARDFSVSENFSLTPLTYLSYGYIRQNKFSESDAAFAKEYKAVNHHTTLATIGLNAVYKIDGKFDTKISAHALYERRLSGREFTNKVNFKRYKDKHFSQKYMLDKELYTFGVDLQTEFNSGVYFRVGTAGEFAKKQENYSFMTTIGYRFN